MVPGPWSGEVVSSKSSPAPRFYIFILVFLDQWFDRRGGRILILFILQLAPTALKSGSIFSSEFPQRCVVLHYNLTRLAKYFGDLFHVITILQEVMICLAAYLLAQHQNFNLSLDCPGIKSSLVTFSILKVAHSDPSRSSSPGLAALTAPSPPPQLTTPPPTVPQSPPPVVSITFSVVVYNAHI